jgi:hypothetical protein
MKRFAQVVLLALLPLCAQNSPTSQNDPWQALNFLNGTWEAKTPRNGGPTVNGTYTFQRELKGHVLARHSTKSGCSGPNDFDCQHSDLLYIFEEAPGLALKAIYFDNEGHVIHYDVSTPGPTTAIFLSEPSQHSPQFRLVYELKDVVMSGKFQIRMPGQTEWKTYLEWSGAKIKS